MNGKNRRAGMKCFQRAQEKAPPTKPTPPPPDLFSITFPADLKSVSTTDQLSLLKYFESYPTVNPKTAESFSYNANTPYRVVNLYNSDFANGTVIIKTPGVYVLKENIVFNPNESNDFLPTASQISSGLYPVGTNGPYHLGFFAAIAVAAQDVVIDLNGFTIEQSTLHNLQQRFYAHIELANSPFVPNQGPHSFIDSYVAANRVLVTGGTLGNSSHHGVHGNVANSVVIHNVTMNEFEVAGVALNGTILGILSKLTLNGITKEIRVLSSYPQALFLRRHMENVSSPTVTLDLPGGSKTFANAITDINTDLNAAKAAVVAGNTPSNFMGNTTGKYDGNMYGIVLHVRGVVVNDFLTSRPESAIGNQNILVYDNSIRNITTHPVEIIALDTDGTPGVYGTKSQIGPFGDVLNMSEIIDISGSKYLYNENSLSNGQLVLAKHKLATGLAQGSLNIEQSTIDWVESALDASNADLNHVMSESGRTLLANGDSMAHLMKGNLGLFISGGQNINVNTITIDGVNVLGNDVAAGTLTNNGTALSPQYTKGADAIGIAVTASDNITFTNKTIQNITTANTNGAEALSTKSIAGNTNITGL